MATPNEEQLKDLVATYEKGTTLAVLAQSFGVSIPTVTKWVRKGGGTIRPRGQRKKGTVVPTALVEVTDAVETFEPRESFEQSPQAPRRIFNAEV